MEHGTDCELAAVRDRWEAMERRHRRANRLLRGLVGLLGGVVLVILGVANEVCFSTVRGGTTQCTTAVSQPGAVVVVVFGLALVVLGAQQGWTALRS